MFGLPLWAGIMVLAGAILAVEIAIWRLVIIPRSRIDQVGTTRSHLGRRARHPFLRIGFRDEAGEPDVAAFDVGRDTGPWEEALAAG